jgi:hypothetical protein
MKAGADFGGMSWRYMDESESVEHQISLLTSGDKLKFVVGKVDGRAVFWAVSSVPCPPAIHDASRLLSNLPALAV